MMRIQSRYNRCPGMECLANAYDRSINNVERRLHKLVKPVSYPFC